MRYRIEEVLIPGEYPKFYPVYTEVWWPFSLEDRAWSHFATGGAVLHFERKWEAVEFLDGIMEKKREKKLKPRKVNHHYYADGFVRFISSLWINYDL